jgi:hypothetical protein
MEVMETAFLKRRTAGVWKCGNPENSSENPKSAEAQVRFGMSYLKLF